MTILLVESLGLVLLLVGSAFFSSAETALFSLNPIHVHRIRRRNALQADRVQKLLNVPRRLLSTILMGNTLVNVSAAALGYMIAEDLFPGYGEAVSIPAMTVLLLLFGEVAPKRLAIARPEKTAILYSGLLLFWIRILAPFRFVVEKSTVVFNRYLHTAKHALTEDEFRTVVEVGEQEGVLDTEERTMIEGIIRLEDTQASDVMTPRVDFIGIDLEDPEEGYEHIARDAGYRYLPVYRGTMDEVEGFLDVPRFLLSPDRNWRAAMIPPFFVPETVPLDTLLTTFQKEHRRIAFVIDEFGGTAGLVTRGDILEEIVADVDNEFGDSRRPIENVGPHRWFVDGSTSLEDINYELRLSLEAEGADRIAGWVAAMAERIPRTGEVVQAQGCRVTVQRVRRNRITSVILEKLPHDNVAEKE